MKNWYEIRAKSGNAEILIFDEIGFFGITAKRFVEDLKALGEIGKIVARINSPGGSVFDGTAIFNALKTHKARVEVHVDGIAASIASVIAMAGDTVVMPSNTMMMIHDPAGMVRGTAKDMRKIATALDKIKSGIVSAYTGKSGQERETIEALMAEETWFTADEAVELGLADRTVDAVPVTAGFDLSKFRNTPENLAEFCSASSTGAQEAATRGERMAKETDMPQKDKASAAKTPANTDGGETGVAPQITNAEALAEAYPKLVDEIRGAATQAERTRLQALEDVALPGFGELLAECKADGSSAEQFALKQTRLQKEMGSKALDDLRADAATVESLLPNPGAGQSGVENNQTPDPDPDDEDAWTEKDEAIWAKDKNIRAEFGGDKAAFLAYQKADRAGNVRIFGRAATA